MKYLMMNFNKEEEGLFAEKDLLDMAKNHDERINRNTLVCLQNSSAWQSIAASEELEFVRDILYKDSSKLIWPRPPKKGKRSGVLISFFLPGVGQIYLGQIPKGACILSAHLLIGLVTWGVGSLPIWILGMIDTYKLQKKLLSGQPIRQWDFF